MTSRDATVAHLSNPLATRDALAGLNIRVTYRTQRVLAAIEGHPGASNGEVALSAGITDRAQISRLLARLQGLGLIENAHGAREGRSRNSWQLTEQGREFRRATEPEPLDAVRQARLRNGSSATRSTGSPQ
jgi:DNA-binding MarR family transcriptional regulator